MILNGLVGAILLLILFTGCSKESEVTVTLTTKSGRQITFQGREDVRVDGEYVVVTIDIDTMGGQLKESQLLDMGNLRTLVALKKAYPKMPATVTLAQVGRKGEMVDGINTYCLETKYRLADLLNACE